jgi:hypothetical protein
MAGLVPAIHGTRVEAQKGVDARDEYGHDGMVETSVRNRFG